MAPRKEVALQFLFAPVFIAFLDLYLVCPFLQFISELPGAAPVDSLGDRFEQPLCFVDVIATKQYQPKSFKNENAQSVVVYEGSLN